MLLRASDYDRVPPGSRCDGDDVRANTLRAAAEQLPQAAGVEGFLQLLKEADINPLAHDGAPDRWAGMTEEGVRQDFLDFVRDATRASFRCYPCPDCGTTTVDGHSIDCPRWMLALTADPAKPGTDRSVATAHQADDRAGIADLPCGCIVTELRVGVRMTPDQLGAEAYCMVCEQTLTGVDVVAVQR